ncbi:FHF complex subunit HOOK interacting protein 2A-like [Ptychodera flava]|uniref:FHF complex subunit HOOK interacting protein 2A-like n=1 Tax=Ptychodera flava TaxID=63121 RepID=UPI00396A36BB
MFNKFAAVLQQAVEALAPTLSLQEDFVFHWKAVTHYFIDNKDDTIPVGETNIPSHMEQMLDILTQEESTCEANQTGPCMEYLLQHKILETLYALGKADCPSGMKQVVFTFFTNLIGKIKQPLLPHVHVHGPVHRLIKVCGEVKAGPTEKEEIQFLCMVCAKLKADPYLVNFFLEAPKTSASYNHTHRKAERNAPASSYKKIASEIGQPEFNLVTSLLCLLQSPDTRVAVKAGEGLMLVTSLPEINAAKCIVDHTQFCAHISDRLCTLYQQLPIVMDPVDVDTVEVTWGLDMYSEAEDDNTFPGKRALISLLSWFDYCDEVIKNAHPIIGRALAKDIRHRFYDPIMEPQLLQASEVGILTSTALLIKFVKMTSSSSLLSETVYFLLGNATEKEKPGELSSKLRHRFIERCDHLSHEISIVSLKLFEVLLLKPHEHIIVNLVLRNLAPRTYHAPPGMNSDNEMSDSISGSGHDDDALSDRPDSPMFDDSDLPPIGLDGLEHLDDPALLASFPIDFPEIRCRNWTVITSSTRLRRTMTLSMLFRMSIWQGWKMIKKLEVKLWKTMSEKTKMQRMKWMNRVRRRLRNKQRILLSVSNHRYHHHDRPHHQIPFLCLWACFHRSYIQYFRICDERRKTWHPCSSSRQRSLCFRVKCDNHKLSKNPEICNFTSFNFRFLTLVPEYIKSSPITDSGYDTYLRDAHRQFRECSVQCLRWDWPTYPKSLDRVDYSEAFYEGFFLKVLFDKMSQMLDQPYEVNLQLTSVLSKLSQFPHPHIHEFFINPYLQLSPGCRCLYTVLKRVIADVKGRMKMIPDFQRKCIQVRRQLTDMEEEDGSPQIELMEGVIVLEEFCKELAAVAFVKAHAESGRI